MKKLIQGITVLMIAIATIICAMPGCENDESVASAEDILPDFNSTRRDDPNLKSLTIEPESGTVTDVGQVFSFRVTDGKGSFVWEAADSSAGTISVTGSDDRTATYTVAKLADNDIVVYDSQGNVAIAELNRVTSTLSIIPDSLSIPANIGDQYNLMASGGDAPYTWSVVIPSLGDFTGAEGTNVTYRVGSANAGTNTVVLVDTSGDYTTATIIHN